MFETFGTKYKSYYMQRVVIGGTIYLMKRDGSVYFKKTDLPRLKDQEIIEQVQKQAAKDGGWDVR